ncbi:glycosyltransferase [Tannerella sp.]|uniref:glycosyltransferase n=1 Tax=Tannerella sp. TaxID=2382127 RepID=UPI0026DD0241|nr:glycosyltransferase [Tannerella sp.]
MSQYHQLTVLYGTSGDHLGDRGELETYIQENPLPNTRFIFVEATKSTNRINYLNKKGIFVYTFYFAYRQWHKSVYKKAQEILKEGRIDLIHYVSPIGYREPGYLWKIKLPYIWGPIGGTNDIPLRLWGSVSSISGKTKLLFRTLANQLQLHFSPRVKKALKRCDVLLTATMANQQRIGKVHHVESYWLPENGIVGKIHHANPTKFNSAKLHVIWIGRIDANKALILLLKALIRLPSDSPLMVHIVGDGCLKKKMEKFASKKQIQHVLKWHGQIDREKVFDLFNMSHLHVITSLSEGNPTTIWEAMSYGVPTMSLDHCGMHDVICEKCGIRIPTNSSKQIVSDISRYMMFFMEHPEQLKALAEGVTRCAQNFRWDKRIQTFNTLYDDMMLTYEYIKHSK